MKKSRFNLSHPASFTAKMGYLIPFCVIDAIPNDTFKLSTRSFIRAQPMLAPLMHQINFITQWWFVPYRILWTDWQDFITGGSDGAATPTFPTIKVIPKTSSLADYFGIPVMNSELEVSAMFFRAYAEIWNTRYRDEDLQAEIPISYDSGLDTVTSTDLKRCAWKKDYFTTARPWTQRGAQISVPVQGSTTGVARFRTSIQFVSLAPSDTFNSPEPNTGYVEVEFHPDYFKTLNFNGLKVFTFDIPELKAPHTLQNIESNESQYVTVNVPTGINSVKNVVRLSVNISQEVSEAAVDSHRIYSSYNLVDDKFDTAYGNPVIQDSTYTIDGSMNIRDLRLASATQRYQENSATWGNRYEEFIQREFGIRPKDARIQRPEYLGGAETPLRISEVLQTAEGENTGVGTMRGHGVGALSTRRIKVTTPEHGLVIGLFSIRPNLVWSQGLNKMFRKFAKFDYFTPEFAHIGMQEIMQSEIYATGTNYDTVFGYGPRYEEYRRIPSRISGEFRNLLDYWNLSRKFDQPPVLNSSFIEMNPSTRIFAEQTQDQFLCMCQNDVIAYRPIPKKAKNILQ